MVMKMSSTAWRGIIVGNQREKPQEDDVPVSCSHSLKLPRDETVPARYVKLTWGSSGTGRVL